MNSTSSINVKSNLRQSAFEGVFVTGGKACNGRELGLGANALDEESERGTGDPSAKMCGQNHPTGLVNRLALVLVLPDADRANGLL